MGWQGSLDSSSRENRMRRRELVQQPLLQSNNNEANLARAESYNEYNQAVKDFINKRDFKNLARQNNLNLKGKFIQSKVGVKFNSITLDQDENERNIYWLKFKYSASEQSIINIYLWASVIFNAEGMPSEFTIPKEYPSAIEIEVEKSKGVELKSKKAFINIEKYEGIPLFNHTHKYYPWIITITPKQKPKNDENGVSEFQNLITYWDFKIDKSTNVMQISPLYQSLIAFETAFLLQQIYGINDALEDNKKGDLRLSAVNTDSNMEDGQLWVICISEEKNTVVMPCGHLWVCKDWATTISQQASPDCPICRNKVKSFVPLNISSIKKIEREAFKHAETGKTIKEEDKGDNEEYGEGVELSSDQPDDESNQESNEDSDRESDDEGDNDSDDESDKESNEVSS